MLCGSDRAESLNAVVANAIATFLAGGGASVVPVRSGIEVPGFRPDLVDHPPHAVAVVQKLFSAADGVVFVVPEYAGGPPGWVKNVTDWMVGSASLHQRPVAVASAATGGGRHAIQQLARTLTWQGAFVVATCGIAGPSTKIRAGEVNDPATLADLGRLSARLLRAITGGVEASTTLAEETLEPLGVDLHDRTT